jgi:PhzF family phenazine biosynthesis protein
MKIYQVDAFTTEPFKGNPAGVCLLEKTMPEEWMRSLAMEMNLSETAFLLPKGDAFSLRWFTPRKEVRLCGHATLASAHILLESGIVQKDQTIQFDTLSGRLTARQDDGWIELDFPVRHTSACEGNSAINQALGVKPVATAISPSEMGDYYLLELDSDTIVREMAPDFIQLEVCKARAVIVTSRSSDPQFDFVSRFFAPWLGINEDPVTGSAHCYLAPYWAGKLGKSEFRAYQASARGGVMGCRWEGERVFLRGQAVTIFKGEMTIKDKQ